MGNYKVSTMLHHNPTHESVLNQSALLHIVDDSVTVSRQAKKRNFTPGEGIRNNNHTTLNHITHSLSPNAIASKRERKLKSPSQGNIHSGGQNSTLRQGGREHAASAEPTKSRNQSR